MSEGPRPGTTASVERHVEHLAEKVDGLETRMAAVELNQAHARELQERDFKIIESGQKLVLATLERIEDRLATKDVEAAKAMSDPMETAAGRAIMAVIKDVIGDVSDIKKKVYMGAGAIGLITLLAPVIAPFIRAAFGLP